MSTAPEQLLPPGRYASRFEIETLANGLVALLDDFEAAIMKGHVPPEFAERLAQIRQAAEHLIDP